MTVARFQQLDLELDGGARPAVGDSPGDIVDEVFDASYAR